MPRIDPDIMVHQLKVDPKCKPICQKNRNFVSKRNKIIEEEVNKLLAIQFIRKAHYPNWIANVVMVKKFNGKWRMCVDFTDLNKAYPKDSFSLPKIDKLVDATIGYELLSFINAFSRYNHIKMYEPNEEKAILSLIKSYMATKLCLLV